MTTPDFPILYACVARGPVVLAELPATDALRSLAARCLAATPRFHGLYTHTVGGRAFAFLMDSPLVFFAIASVPCPNMIPFLSRLNDAVYVDCRSVDACYSPLCFQDELLPVFQRLVSRREETETSRAQPREEFGSKQVNNKVEIPVDADYSDDSAQQLWKWQACTIIRFHLVICSILFGVWLSMCRGFSCIAG